MNNVLYIQHPFQRESLDSFARYLQKENSCNLYTLTNEKESLLRDRLQCEINAIKIPRVENTALTENQLLQTRNVMCACEKAAGIALSSIFLSCERTMGRGLSKSQYLWEENYIGKRSLIDNSYPNHYLEQLFQFLYQVITDNKIDFIIGGPKGGDLASVAHFLSEHLQIHYFARYRSRFINDRHFWTSRRDLFNEVIEHRINAIKTNQLEPSSQANEILEKFQNKPETPAQVKLNWQRFNRFNASRLRNIAQTTIKRTASLAIMVLKNKTTEHRKPIFEYLKLNILAAINKKKCAPYFNTYESSQLSSMKYVFFPLHKLPEFGPNTQTPAWYNAVDTILCIAQSLPFGYQLLIKEHPLISERRRIRIVKEIANFPNVKLIHALEDQYKYIMNANLIITENGTAGLEGAMNDIPVLNLSHSYYDAGNLTIKLNKKDDIAICVYQMCSKKLTKYNSTLDKQTFIEAEIQSTIPNEKRTHDDDLQYINNIIKQKINNNITKKESSNSIRMPA